MRCDTTQLFRQVYLFEHSECARPAESLVCCLIDFWRYPSAVIMCNGLFAMIKMHIGHNTRRRVSWIAAGTSTVMVKLKTGIHRKTSTIVIGCVGCFFGNVYMNTGAAVAEPLDVVVITATRTLEPADRVPADISVVSGEELVARGEELIHLLVDRRAVPGEQPRTVPRGDEVDQSVVVRLGRRLEAR